MRDNTEAFRFISALTGSPFSEVTFQAFYDPKNTDTPKGVYPETWTATLNDSLEFIDYKQSQHCGIYVCVNGTDGQGRELENIVDLRAVFVDFDGMYEPTWALPPHIVQKRDETHGHAFWLIEASDLSHEEWTILQKQLSMFYGSDSQVIDPSRVIRLPGSTHFKDLDNPTSYVITEDNTGNGHKYQIQDIRDAHALSPELDVELNDWVIAREVNQTGAGYDNDTYEINRFISFATNAAHPAVLGSGTLELFRVACYGHDHGIDLGNTTAILWEHYNPRCMPPWRDDEREHFESVCHRAYKYPSSAAGCKSTKAQFLALPALQEPSCGWENSFNQFHNPVKIDANDAYIVPALPVKSDDYDRGLRIANTNAKAMLGTLTAKSSHYNFAQVFDGLKYDGINLIRADSQFYRYGGKSWKPVKDDVIKAEIHRTFRKYEPANKFTAGVFQVLCDMVNVESVTNGMWLTDKDRDTSNLAVFKNLIVDLNTYPVTLIEHTPEFFVMNELNYDFDQTAKCPAWEAFLTSIWDDNQSLKDQLQEFMGYCLTADNSLHRFAILTGKSRGGKGVITDVITEMVGESNMCSPGLANLVKDSALCEMSSKSLILIPDAHNVSGSIRDTVLSNLKAITGGDSLSYHELYKGSRNSKFSGKIVMSTNNLPTFTDSSGALMNRALVFRFWKSFAGIEDVSLRGRLMSEMAGITQWAIAGLRRLRANKGRFTESSDGLEMKDEMRKDMFPLSGYIDDCVEMVSSGYSSLEDLYKAYRIWTASEGLKNPMTKVLFNQTLRNSALDITHENNGYHGMKLKPIMMADNILKFK